MKEYRLEIKINGKWRIGTQDYTEQEALDRVEELSRIEIQSRVVKFSDWAK